MLSNAPRPCIFCHLLTLALLKYAHARARAHVLVFRLYWGNFPRLFAVARQRTARCTSSSPQITSALSVCLSAPLCQRSFLARSTTCHALSGSPFVRLSNQFCTSLSRLPSLLLSPLLPLSSIQELSKCLKTPVCQSIGRRRWKKNHVAIKWAEMG